MRKVIPKITIYEHAINEGKWNIKYDERGTSFPLWMYEDLRYNEFSFKYSNQMYIVSRNRIKRFYAEYPQIKIIKFDAYRLLIPLSICEEVDLSD